jgi:hypothetical protein
VLSAGGSVTRAEQDKKDDKKEDRKTIETKGTKETGPVDFASALGLGLESLKTLGARVDQARSANDPVCLALAAKELHAAEEVSGKHASVKSADLLKEAVEMAKARNRPDELKVVAKLLGEDKEAKQLMTQAERTTKEIAARAAEKGEPKTKGITGDLIVRNRTAYYIDIYVNFTYEGTVPPYETRKTFVGDSPSGTTVLQGKAPGTSYTWGPKAVSGNVSDYTWTLTP